MCLLITFKLLIMRARNDIIDRRAPFTSTPLWNKCAVFLKRVMNRVTSHDACITTMVYSPTVMPKPNLWFLFA